ncbi:MAG: Trk family potassium uptake protein [Lachnospiraceae bacterium]|nr:Trk family potassium uptake protein [Lachnospiraceae bacterium]
MKEWSEENIVQKSPINKKKKWSSSQIIILGFLAVIGIGCILLMLPVSSNNGQATPLLNALFTATSATCVTGLVVYDTATHWSLFGQIVILLLIQIGGMGVVTIAVSIALVSGKKIGLMQRSTMQEAISAPEVGGIIKLTGFLLRTTIIIELAGALLMLPVFVKDYGWKGIWYAIFHSISAFCNAGFDLMGEKQAFSSLTAYSANGLLNFVVIALIIIGGIGFMTWDDIRREGIHIKRYRMQSKVILLVTTILIVIPFCLFLFGEFNKDIWSDMTLGEKMKASLFQSVTLRTAGFNTVDLTRFSEAGWAVMIVLMLIGGSPGSTAGGMKTTTIAVLFMTLLSVFGKKQDTECMGRRVADETIKNAAAILLMYITLFFMSGIIISYIEGLPVITCLFETASAIGTVGLTLGITTQLSSWSKIILILLMYTGRVGGLTLVYATFSNMQGNVSKLPKEKITVG